MRVRLGVAEKFGIGGWEGVTTGDWSLALATGGNAGVSLHDANTATPRVRLAGAGAQVANLVLTAVADGVAEATEEMTVALGPDGTGANGFDRAALGTNVGGGANPDPTHNAFTVMLTDIALELRLAVASASENEGNSGHRDIDVVVSKPAGTAAVFYNLCFSGTASRDEDGTRDAGEDYQVVSYSSGNPVQALWGSGARAGCVGNTSAGLSPSETSHAWKIRVLGDTAPEGSEEVVVNAAPEHGGGPGAAGGRRVLSETGTLSARMLSAR